jgi:hypothetical protein
MCETLEDFSKFLANDLRAYFLHYFIEQLKYELGNYFHQKDFSLFKYACLKAVISKLIFHLQIKDETIHYIDCNCLNCDNTKIQSSNSIKAKYYYSTVEMSQKSKTGNVKEPSVCINI